MKVELTQRQEGKAVATHRQFEAFCPNGHRLPKITIAVDDEQSVTCRKCKTVSTFAVRRDGEHLAVDVVTVR